jgi:hypothetical protein
MKNIFSATLYRDRNPCSRTERTPRLSQPGCGLPGGTAGDTTRANSDGPLIAADTDLPMDILATTRSTSSELVLPGPHDSESVRAEAR